jgi:hypothetical protein
MKARRHCPIFPAAGALALLVCLAPALPAAPAAKTDPFARTKARIDALLKSRLNVAPLPDDIANPFTLPGKEEPVAINDTPPPTTKADDAEILARLVPQLKIGGFVQLGSVPRIIINQTPYKEGDIVIVRRPEGITYLRVKHIDSNYLTIELNNAEQTIKF